MIWLSWRQFRVQALVGAGLLVAFAIYAMVLGRQIHHTYGGLAPCRSGGACAGPLSEFLDLYRNRVYLLDLLVLIMPALVGMFWGAPLIAREYETGTHRLVWSQSVTRRQWLLTKLLVVGLLAVAVAGLVSALATAAAWPYDQVAAGPLDPLGAGRFSGLLFGARNVAPVAHAALALVLGAMLGLLVRRTVPTMALTLLLFVTVQVVTATQVRPHLMPAVTVSTPMTADAINHLARLGSLTGAATVGGLKIPGAWVTSTSPLLTADGRPLDERRFNDCISGPPDPATNAGPDRAQSAGPFGGAADCLGRLNLHLRVSYQPVARYWPFQWRESAIFLGLCALLTGLGLARIQRRAR